MFEELIQNLVLVKQEFAKKYIGNAHIQEVIPTSVSKKFQIDINHLEILHAFAQKNPIYFNSYEQEIAGISCTVYEGDINEYWLNSIKHGSSCQPFYPTWIMSAYVLTLIAKQFVHPQNQYLPILYILIVLQLMSSHMQTLSMLGKMVDN